MIEPLPIGRCNNGSQRRRVLSHVNTNGAAWLLFLLSNPIDLQGLHERIKS